MVSMMNEQSRLLLALLQIENITQLISNNEYETYFLRHLTPVRHELKRQLTNSNSPVKLKE